MSSFLFVNVMHVHEGTSMVMRSKAAFVEALRRSEAASQIVNPSGYFSDASEFLDMARRGLAFGLGAGTARLNPIHGADLAAFCVDRLGDGSGEWNVGGPGHLQVSRHRGLGVRRGGQAAPNGIGPLPDSSGLSSGPRIAWGRARRRWLDSSSKGSNVSRWASGLALTVCPTTSATSCQRIRNRN